MKKKKIIKITLISIATLFVMIAGVLLYGYCYFEEAYNTENKPYKNYIGYIDQNKALLNNKYQLCNDGDIYNTYSGAGLKAYKGSKKQFRDALNANFNTNNYTDSGYLNFRFLVNCEGNAGWFEIIEMDLNLKEKPLNKKMVEQLFKFTSNPTHWNVIPYNNEPQNYYMYVSYRIENGKVTQIIP
ncbi:hypothetical protein LNI90_02945 [Tenacibaculum dicentrarchi]|nr:hypothetical protein [Tenacibaculum dicentrarchi]MCD8419225.1 hypothetical protein [Tenacibaculum dicentrarchi]MCD8451032.1 hypothetical protein [Tenacibaculum dicentrarchi]MCG8827138.1 hypothetical protein [Tenacibaculum dicentrarchi]WBX68649.1 hypothetical protein PG910_11350 [Tenacibaculum dicentrarchi]